MAATSFPPIRACIFDMDGLLINSEDIIGQATNQLLEKHARPHLTQSMRARLMGVAGSTSSDMFHDWAKLPITREAWAVELGEQMRRHFQDCEPLPGAEALLFNLRHARTLLPDSGEHGKIELALASTTKTPSYKLKTSRPATKQLLSFFQPERRVLGDDPRLPQGRSKPAPDIYLLALESLNSTISSTSPILPKECLVFEDSVAGVEAARRAEMRVVWVPHPDLALEYQARQKDVLAGRTDLFDIGDDWQLGQVDDGWAERIASLEHFDYTKYGLHLPS
ncbi:putative HAD superfamily hydrolase [Cercophora newfieldiana]|uniref:HAD superfamily hydrolase n=1 Tax=Cercophora newfieldiana TaxID=92897 RepID=A0AA40CY74_9PEZI|nr:putative HAD superfamily hydrolase [Cercophora newfieldiana]